MSQARRLSEEDKKCACGGEESGAENVQTENLELYEESTFLPSQSLLDSGALLWNGAWDSKGVYVYQAFNDSIADYALEHQKFEGCQAWQPDRGTWIKPSLAWMLYRSGYGHKVNQNRILQIHLSHQVISHILNCCKLTNTNRETRGKNKLSNQDGGGNGVIQWDPERDLYSSEKNLPRRMLRRRAIQVCMTGKLSRLYASNILSIKEVTELAHQIGGAHKIQIDKNVEEAVRVLMADMPPERSYFPALVPDAKLQELGMLSGVAAEVVNGLGRGKACPYN